ncbi:MAG: sulfur oxidation c-type cytochrome SoxX [Gammaproteobacteria bacterium]|nr:sulfur oxidation c-type cytochrome SoxX [Gammaproteobacteria bacterium]
MAAVAFVLASALAGTDAAAAGVAAYRVVGDAVPEPLAGLVGDPVRGRDIVLDRRRGNCLICHAVPVEDEPFQGDIGPPLAGVGRRLDEARLRLRIVDSTLLNPDSVMPAYHRTHELNRVAAKWRGKPVLDAGEVEDVVAYLASLQGR